MNSLPQISQVTHTIIPVASVSKLGPYDILCGRHKESFNHTGNRRFRVLINLNLQRYIDSPSRSDRADLIRSLVRELRNEAGVRFFKKKGSIFVELSEEKCREKVGHALRDTFAHQQRQQQGSISSYPNAKNAKMTIKKTDSSNQKIQKATVAKRQPTKSWPIIPIEVDIDNIIVARQHHSNSQKEQHNYDPDDFSLSDDSFDSILSTLSTRGEEDGILFPQCFFTTSLRRIEHCGTLCGIERGCAD
jgi:hypothetical protein